MIRVKATRLGYYGIHRRRPGDVFDIKEEKEFSEEWMEKVGPKVKGPAASPAKLSETNRGRAGVKLPVQAVDEDDEQESEAI